MSLQKDEIDECEIDPCKLELLSQLQQISIFVAMESDSVASKKVDVIQPATTVYKRTDNSDNHFDIHVCSWVDVNITARVWFSYFMCLFSL